MSDFSHCIYNFTESTMERGVDPRPPDNPHSWNNTLFIKSELEIPGAPLHIVPNRPAAPRGTSVDAAVGSAFAQSAETW